MKKTVHQLQVMPDKSMAEEYNVADLPIFIQRNDKIEFVEGKSVMHWNRGLETLIFQKGNAWVYINGVLRLLSEGDICVIAPGTAHYLEQKEGTECLFHCIILEQTLFSPLEGMNQKFFDPLFHSPHPSHVIISKGSEESGIFQKILADILLVNQDRPSGFELQMVSLGYEYIVQLYRHYQKTLFQPIDENDEDVEVLQKLSEYVAQHVSEPITVEDLCRAGAVSRNRCFQIFKKQTDVTPAHFILVYRTVLARQMLANTDYTIAEIAGECGFTHQSHLTNHFTKAYGVTPLQYRKRKEKRD